MPTESPLWWRMTKLFLTKRAEGLAILRFLFLRKVGIRYHKRFGRTLSPLPSNLTILPTLQCNLNCIMCAQNVHRKDRVARPERYDPKRELPFEKWVSFLDQISASRPPLYVTGGEPLLYPKFRELIREIKKRKIYVHLATNGTLLSKEADFLVEAGVEGITISIDGPPDVHDRIRGTTGIFSRAAEGAMALVDARRRHKALSPMLAFICTLTKSNYQYLEEAVECVINLGGDHLQVNHATFYSPDLVAKHNAMFTPESLKAMGLCMELPSIHDGLHENDMEREDIRRLLELMERVKRQAKGRIMLTFEPRLSADLVEPYYLDLAYPFEEECNSLWGSLNVGPDGRVSPCLNFLVGNIMEDTIADIWNGEMMQRLRALIADGLLPGCQRCNRRTYCKSSRCMI